MVNIFLLNVGKYSYMVCFYIFNSLNRNTVTIYLITILLLVLLLSVHLNKYLYHFKYIYYILLLAMLLKSYFVYQAFEL